MVEKLKAVLKTLNDNTEDAGFTHFLDVNKRRYVFLGEIDCENQYVLAISENCLQDNSVEILQNTTTKALPLIKDNPNKTVFIKSDLVIELELA